MNILNVVKVVPDSLTRLYDNYDAQQGIGYLMRNVGQSVKGTGMISPSHPQIFHPLSPIFTRGIEKGDRNLITLLVEYKAWSCKLAAILSYVTLSPQF